jgi:hypothetical protein
MSSDDPSFPPFSDWDTSFQAAESVQDITGRLRLICYRFIFACKAHGATCDEVEVALDLRHQTASARLYELKNQRAIVDSGWRRPTRSGRSAAVWVHPRFAEHGR